MAYRQVGQLGFGDAAVSAARQGRTRDRLADIDALLDWRPIDAKLRTLHVARRGEPPYPPLVMFKILLLGVWYGLSDPETEEAVSDRLSFRRFAGLALEDATPDHSTIWRFRDRLAKNRLMEPLMEALSRQLDQRGLILRQGTLIDATIVQSAAKRPPHDKPKDGGKGRARTSPVDPEARFGTTNDQGRFDFGYKLHLAMDKGSGLVRGIEVTPANVQEINVAAELVQGDELAVYADRGYSAQWFRDFLNRAGIADGVLLRQTRTRPLTPEQAAHNHKLSRQRRPVEKIFGTLKRSYRLRRMRHFSMARNVVTLSLACFGYNLRRLQVLSAG